MLVPAVLYKEQIHKEFKKLYYTDDMLLETGCMENWIPDIPDEPSASKFDYAIVDDNKKLIGYLSYNIDWYVSKACNFGLMSFDRGNPIIGRDVYIKLRQLVKQLHKVEWRMVGGNPIEKHYDKFCNRYKGNKLILKDSIRDKDGNYRDDVLYEIINPLPCELRRQRN